MSVTVVLYAENKCVSKLRWLIGSKYENGLPCDCFLAKTQPRS